MNSGGENQSRSVLVVDDDADIRSIVVSLVNLVGHCPEEFGDGEQALERIRRGLPDLVVLDLMMPGKSGIEVCAALRAEPGGEFVPVIMLTAKDSLRDKVAALDGGADDYLTKPFQYQELQARMSAQLRIRELHLKLHAQNLELQRMQEQLLANERRLAVLQIAGTAAHQLGQPLSAILINCHLLTQACGPDEPSKQAIQAIYQDAKRMAALLERLRGVDAEKTSSYYGQTKIIEIEDRGEAQMAEEQKRSADRPK